MVRGLAGGIIAFVVSKKFQGRADRVRLRCGEGTLASGPTCPIRQGGWVSRAEGALSTNVWDRPNRCDKSIFHKVRFAYCEPILCAAPGASSSCCSVTCGTFEPEGSGWGAASSVVQCIVRD